ncbi:MAG TPA: beta-ketoacyl-[acyl-carrier-protein] synthase family protein [Rhodanobacteraceae bacterium]|nr:beta-ketoacyl-[acyl-carrier-protein] synthase family protein [Rhodanobacteraceae bacterium]
MHRVVVTGIGAVTPLGLSATETWNALREGRSAIGPIEAIPREGLRAGIAAELKGFDPHAHFDEKKLILLDRVSQIALVAAREAIAESGIDFAHEGLGENTAVVIGTGVGGEQTNDEASRRLYGENNPRLHPLTIVRLMANAPACQISIEHRLRGPAFATVSACASSNHAIAQAFQMVRAGIADAAITGGTEACLTMGVVRAWEAMRVLADDTCRPFSKQRRGLVLGEGAAAFVLETLDRARARGANVLAEIVGIGMSADAGDIVFPSEAGAASAMQRALADAKLAPDAIDYINAHGTGTPANDPTETSAIRRAFGAHADRLAVSSTKSMHGHALGAAGAIELVATIGALRDGVIPPTANFLDPDPACDLDYVPNVAREQRVRAAFSNSFAFGGLNAVLALARAP